MFLLNSAGNLLLFVGKKTSKTESRNFVKCAIGKYVQVDDFLGILIRVENNSVKMSKLTELVSFFRSMNP